jgi:hypothetical protein
MNAGIMFKYSVTIKHILNFAKLSPHKIDRNILLSLYKNLKLPQLLNIETWVHNPPALDAFCFPSLQLICPFALKNKNKKT